MQSFSYLEPVCCSMSGSNCCLLTCLQVSQEAGQVVCYCIYMFMYECIYLYVCNLFNLGLTKFFVISLFCPISLFIYQYHPLKINIKCVSFTQYNFPRLLIPYSLLPNLARNVSLQNCVLLLHCLLVLTTVEIFQLQLYDMHFFFLKSLMVNPYMTTGKTIDLTRQTFVG